MPAQLPEVSGLQAAFGARTKMEHASALAQN
jgi:hypothetical protein